MAAAGRYCGEGDIVPSLVGSILVAQITKDDPAATTIDDDVLLQHIQDAEAEVDTYLGRRYSLPLAAVPTIVTRLSARLARYRLYTSRPGLLEDWLKLDYENAVSILKDLATGDLALGLTSEGAPTTAPATKRARVSSQPPVFGRPNMGDF